MFQMEVLHIFLLSVGSLDCQVKVSLFLTLKVLVATIDALGHFETG